MTKETGGPAFPIQGFSTRNGQGFQAVMADGMNLRDYFAAKAMQALITSRHTGYEHGWYDEDQVARSAYKMADAMLEARK